MEIINKKKITLDDLAAMLKRQFDFVDDKFKEMATKEDIKKIEIRLDHRIGIIEKIVLGDHRPRIRRIEKEIGI